MTLYEKKMNIMKKVGNMSQIAGARTSRLTQGRADGMLVADVKTGAGLNYCVVADRCMDIAWADYKGHALGFISKAGISDSRFYEHDYDGFHRNFYAGLLTTCGLRNIGPASSHNNEYFGLHGRISNTPADEFSIDNSWVGNEYITTLKGKMRESKLYGENLLLTRTISSALGRNSIKIQDTIENCAFVTEPFTLLYHFNFGFPLLDKDSYLFFPNKKTISRNPEQIAAVDHCDKMVEPETIFPETVFYHEPEANESGWSYAGIFNPTLESKGIGVIIRYDTANLPILNQWKNMAMGDYVIALEPANAYPEGREAIHKKGMLKKLEPGQVVAFDIEIEVFEGAEYINSLKNKRTSFTETILNKIEMR